MSEKFLQALAEDPKLEKQIGCMTGLLQIFDRQQHLTGKRLGYKKIASKEQSSIPSSMRGSRTDGDKHENLQNVTSEGAATSMKSLSQPKACIDYGGAANDTPLEIDQVKAAPSSGSSSASSPRSKELPTTPLGSTKSFILPPKEQAILSKTDSGKCMQNDPGATKDKPEKQASTLSAKKLLNATKPADASSKLTAPDQPKFRDQSISYADLKQSLKVLTKLKDAPWNTSHGTRCLLESKAGSKQPSLKDPPRISYDLPRSSFEFKDYLRASQRAKESPRFSLDVETPKTYTEFKNSLRSHSYKDDLRSFSEGKDLHLLQNPMICEASCIKGCCVDSKIRSPSVVARLMGLEEIPDKVWTYPSTPTKPSKEAKLLQGLLDYTPIHDQTKLGSEVCFSGDAFEKKQDLCPKPVRPSTQFSDAVNLVQPQQSVISKSCSEKDIHGQTYATQLHNPSLSSSRGSLTTLSGSHPENGLKPLSCPRYVMETMPPHHKTKAFHQQRPSSTPFPKSSKIARLPLGGLIKQHKSWDDILKALLQPELFKVSEYFRQAEKARLGMSATELDRSTLRKQPFHSTSSYGSKVPKNGEEQVDGKFRKYSPTDKMKQQLDSGGYAPISSRRIVKGTNSSDSSPARDVLGNQSGSGSNSLHRNACKDAHGPRSVAGRCVSHNRPSRSQQNGKLLMSNPAAAQCDEADDPEGMQRSKYDFSSEKFHTSHPHTVRSRLRSGSEFSPSKKVFVRSCLDKEKEGVVRSVPLNSCGPLSLTFQNDVHAYGNSGGKEHPENVFLQTSNSDVEMPSLESYESSEGDVMSDQHVDGLLLERIEVLSTCRPHPCQKTEAESLRKDTSEDEDFKHQKFLHRDDWMPENQEFKEKSVALHNLNGNELLQSEVVNLAAESHISEQRPTAILSSFAEKYARDCDDQGCDGLLIEQLITRVRTTEAVNVVASPEIQFPHRSLDSTGEVLLRNNNSTEKDCEQPSPNSVLDAACTLDNFSPRIYTAMDQIDFGSGCFLRNPHEQNDSQSFTLLVSAKIPASMPSDQKPTMVLENSLGKAEIGSYSDPQKVVVTEREEAIYVHNILTASNYADQIELFSRPGCSQQKSVRSDYYFMLEQSNSQTKGSPLKNHSKIQRPAAVYRRLLFDTVNEILESGPKIHTKTQKPCNSYETIQPKKSSIQEITHIICTELRELRKHSYVDVGNMLYSMIGKDLENGEQDWLEFNTQAQHILVAIERSIFKQLIEEAISCLTPYAGRCAIAKDNCRKKLF